MYVGDETVKIDEMNIVPNLSVNDAYDATIRVFKMTKKLNMTTESSSTSARPDISIN